MKYYIYYILKNKIILLKNTFLLKKNMFYFEYIYF